MKTTAIAVCAVAAALISSGASAQQVMTSDEILKRFQLQAQQGTQVEQGSTPVVTRGLKLEYNDAPAPQAAVKSNIQPAPAPVRVAAPSPAPQPAAEPSYVSADPKPAPAAPKPVYVKVEPKPAPAKPEATYVEAEPQPAAAKPEPTYVEAEPQPAAAEPTYVAATAEPEPAWTPGVSTRVFQEPVAAPATYVEQESSYTATAAYEAAPVATPVAATASVTDYTPVAAPARIDLQVYFEWNSASLRPEAISQLSELCTAIIQASNEGQFKIIGHTDKSGSADYNLYLSNARAREVKRHLVEECNIPARALLAVGEGERQAPSHTPDNSPSERRVEVQLVS